MNKILNRIECAIKIYSDCVIMGILPFLDNSDYCLLKVRNRFYFCKVDADRLYNDMYCNENNIHNTLKNFVTIVEEFNEGKNLLKTIKQHFILKFSHINDRNGARVYNVYYKKDPTIQINTLGIKRNKLYWGPWVRIETLFNKSYI